MPPKDWRPLVDGFTRIQKLVHLACRQDPVDVQAIASEIFKEKRRAYEDSLTVQAANVGCPGRRGVTPGHVLTEMHEESQMEAGGITNTFNYDLAVAVRQIRSEVPTANRYVYAKRLREWEDIRSEWKSRQISLWNTMKWQDRAVRDFLMHNPVLSKGYAIVRPQNIAVCAICRYWVGRGKVPIEETGKQEWPAHLSCPHYWDMHYRGKVDCNELWVGIPIVQWWEDIEAGKELGFKGGAGSGNWGHAGRPGLIGGSGGKGGGVVTGRLSMQDVDVEFVEGGTDISGSLRQEVWDWGGDRGDIGIAALANMSGEEGGIGAGVSGGAMYRSTTGELIGVHSHTLDFGEGALWVEYLATKRPGVGRAVMTHIAQLAYGSDLVVQLAPSRDAAGFYAKLGLIKHPELSDVLVWTGGAMEEHLRLAYGEKEAGVVDDEPENGVFTVPREDVDEQVESSEKGDALFVGVTKQIVQAISRVEIAI